MCYPLQTCVYIEQTSIRKDNSGSMVVTSNVPVRMHRMEFTDVVKGW